MAFLAGTKQTWISQSVINFDVNAQPPNFYLQRSFRSPLDALRDCVDNAVDANHGEGKIRIFGHSRTVGQHSDPVEGLLIMNSFPEESYKEMNKVLEVFCSNKEQVRRLIL